MKVLYVEDDIHIAKLTAHYLRKKQYDVNVFHHGTEAMEHFHQNPCDFVILDLMLPGMNGIQICEGIRKTSNVPIIMVTAKGEIDDRVNGLNTGADDYLVKPFDPQELVARMEAILRRFEHINPRNELTNHISGVSTEMIESIEAQTQSRITIGDLMIDPISFSVTQDGVVFELPRREFDLLHFMMKHPNHVFTRNDLIEKVWGWDFQGEDRVVDLYVTRLRQRFTHSEATIWQLRTIRGVGYKFEVNR